MHRYESAGRNFLGIPAFRSLSLYCWSSFFILLWYSCRVPAKQKLITSKRQPICDNIFSHKSCVWIKKYKTRLLQNDPYGDLMMKQISEDYCCRRWRCNRCDTDSYLRAAAAAVASGMPVCPGTSCNKEAEGRFCSLCSVCKRNRFKDSFFKKVKQVSHASHNSYCSLIST